MSEIVEEVTEEKMFEDATFSVDGAATALVQGFYGSKVLSLRAERTEAFKLRGTNSPYKVGIRLCATPTNNCQMSTIGNVGAILHPWFTREQRAKMLLDISTYCSTNGMLADVAHYHYDRLIEALEDNEFRILSDAKYTNLTGTKLSFVYFVISEPEYDDEDDEDYDEDDYSEEW